MWKKANAALVSEASRPAGLRVGMPSKKMVFCTRQVSSGSPGRTRRQSRQLLLELRNQDRAAVDGHQVAAAAGVVADPRAARRTGRGALARVSRGLLAHFCIADDHVHLVVGVGIEVVQADHRVHAGLPDGFDVVDQVLHAGLDEFGVDVEEVVVVRGVRVVDVVAWRSSVDAWSSTLSMRT